MKKVSFIVVAVWLNLLTGCSDQTQSGEPSEMLKTMTGEVFYRERILLPPEAELRITLEDVSRMDVASTVIASYEQTLSGAPPYAFNLTYSESSIEPRMQYGLRAKIMLGDKLIFTSTEQLNPFQTPEEDIVIMLTKVGAREEQRQSK